MIQCPFCRSDIHPEATICPQCHARKGYGSNNDGGIHTGGSISLLAIICFALIVGGMLIGDMGYIFAVLGGIGLPFCLAPLARGARWYR